MSIEDYQERREMAHHLRSAKSMRQLIESIAELEAGKGVARELIE